MPLFPQPSDIRLERHGWICSVVFHAVMGTSALALLSNLQIPLQRDSFTWNVAMVEAPKPEPNPEVLPEPKPAQPKPKVTTAQPSPPHRVAQPVEQKIVQQPVQAVQQTIQHQVTHSVRTPTEVTTVNQTASIVTQAVRQTEVNETVAPTTTRERVVQEEQIVTTKVAQAAPLVTEPTVDRQAAQPVQHQAIEAAVEQITRPQQVVESATVETAAEPVTQPRQTASLQTVETVVERALTEHAGAAAAHEQPATVEQTVAHMAPTRAVPATKADYGWLMRTLLSRVNQLKNYPHMARINHWEGKVVLRAVIKDDGQVLTIDVHESSGRSVLDNDAMETLRKASPLKLEHPLGKPQVAILMPISYSLR